MSIDFLGATLLGGIAALGSAASWAVGSILFRRIGDLASPQGMNLAKGLLGLLYLGAVLLIVGFVPVDGVTLGLLVSSGVVGIALGDTFFFQALIRLDPRLTVVLATVGQVFTVLLAIVVLAERPTFLSWVGMGLVLLGVFWVLWDQLPKEEGARRVKLAGVGYGLASAACMAVGIILAKLAVEDVPALQATTMRLAAGMLALACWGGVQGQLVAWLQPFRERGLFKQLVVADLVIILGGFYLSMLALELTDASIATVLNATEPLFMLPLAVFVLREKLTIHAVLGAVVAVGGVGMVLIGLGGG